MTACKPFPALADMADVESGDSVHVAVDGRGLIANDVRLSDDTIRRSELLLHIRDSCTGSTYLPLKHDTFMLWCRYEPGGSSWSELVTVMEVSSTHSW